MRADQRVRLDEATKELLVLKYQTGAALEQALKDANAETSMFLALELGALGAAIKVLETI